MTIYLDYAATTPVDERVMRHMAQHLTQTGVFANPASSSHKLGQAANNAVKWARTQVANLIGANNNAIIWTSGATESNNLALKGAAQYHQKKGKHIITSKTEHRAVLDVCGHLISQGFEVTYLDPNTNGVITIDEVRAAVREDTILVSVMYANNETGIINDIANIGRFTRDNDIIFHVDGAQAVGKIPIDVNTEKIDLLSLNAHKLYGPKGIGALYVCRKPRIRLQAQIHGGGHERGLRSGTLPTHQIIGMGEAYRLAAKELEQDTMHINALSAQLWTGISDISEVSINGENATRLTNILNVRFHGIDSEQLTEMLNHTLAISSGSACSSASKAPSYVLKAMNLTDEQALSSVRLSIGRQSTAEEIEQAITHIRHAVIKLRSTF